jgi:hypothetical protein
VRPGATAFFWAIDWNLRTAVLRIALQKPLKLTSFANLGNNATPLKKAIGTGLLVTTSLLQRGVEPTVGDIHYALDIDTSEPILTKLIDAASPRVVHGFPDHRLFRRVYNKGYTHLEAARRFLTRPGPWTGGQRVGVEMLTTAVIMEDGHLILVLLHLGVDVDNLYPEIVELLQGKDSVVAQFLRGKPDGNEIAALLARWPRELPVDPGTPGLGIS